MNWFQSLDIALFRFINDTLSNGAFDRLMPLVSGNAFFVPAVLILGILLIWKGGVRGRLCLFFALLAVAIGDGWICSTIKDAVERPRPFRELADVNLLVGKGKSFSMPSAHAANWFSSSMVALLYFRRSWRFMLPLALIVSFSRIYNGVHYPSDVLAGAILGAGYGAAIVFLGNALWQTAGRKLFPIWWKQMPSLLNPLAPKPELLTIPATTRDQQLLRLGYLLIFLLLAFRLHYIASPTIELSEDEAYQWIWSKHLALSYYSKPPLIALTQFAGTTLWGDTEMGVRFFSPVIAAILSLLLLRFFTREVNVRLGLAVVAILTAAPLPAVGSILMTIDPLSVLFWTAAMLAGWRAIRPIATWRAWLWVGLWMGLGFLSKYTNLFQILCWAILFLLWKPARVHLRRPGPYFALGIVALSLLPVLIWNAQHGWATVAHVANNGGLIGAWKPTLRYVIDFLVAESLLLNPFFFIGMVAAMFFFWRKHRADLLAVFLFSMGAPLFLFYFGYAFHSRILPNWIAPSIVPLFCLMALLFYKSWSAWKRWAKPAFAVGVGFGLFVVVVLHDTDLVSKFFKRTLPAQVDPSRRVRAWRATAHAVERARQRIVSESGRPTFIIGDHYGITGELSFYIPEARRQIRSQPLVFVRPTPRPRNQFYFWPGYESRVGQNAIYVQQVDLPDLEDGWFAAWLRGEKKVPMSEPRPKSLPPEILKQFASISDLGMVEVKYEKRVFRRVRLYECRGLLRPE